jgi:hypothetical protein
MARSLPLRAPRRDAVNSLLFFDHYEAETCEPVFYLGSHAPGWLRTVNVPQLLSHAVLTDYEKRSKKLPEAVTEWANDSSAPDHLKRFGAWQFSAREYVARVRRWRDSGEDGNRHTLAGTMDYLCSAEIRAATGLSVEESQRRTVESYLELSALAPEINFLPTLQGDAFGDYLSHVEMYDRAGVNLFNLDLVGVGSIAFRESTPLAAELITRLHADGLRRLHAFGMKFGIEQVAGKVASFDSHAWSYEARKRAPLPDCEHRKCNNCLKYALKWRDRILRAAARPSGQSLFDFD